MAGFENEVMRAKNMNFDETAPKPHLGVINAAGKFPIGTGNLFPIPEILGGSLTSPDNSITIGYSSPNITAIVNTSLLFKWQDVSGAFLSSRNNGYFITATASSTLPGGASEGDTFKYFVDTTQILTLTASGGQIIRMGNVVSSSGGTAVTTLRGDSVEFVFRSSNQCWCAIAGFTGTWVLA